MYRLIILILLLTVWLSLGQDLSAGSRLAEELTASDVSQQEGVILSLSRLKSGKVQLKIQELPESESQLEKPKTHIYALDWRTMIYKLSTRNRQIFKEQDKLEDIVADVNKLRRRQDEMPEKEMKLLMSHWSSVYYDGRTLNVNEGFSRRAAENLSRAQLAFQREEEERQNHYGPLVKIVPNMIVLVVAASGNDTTYAVLVTGKKEPPKAEKKEKPPESPGKQKETEATRKLKFAKGLVRDAEDAMGADRDRLNRLARARLQEVVDKYPGTTAALEAKKLLEGK